MSAEDAAIKHDIEMLRRDGSAVARLGSAEEAAAWRAAMQRAYRTAGLRVRTGLPNADDGNAQAHHVDHAATAAAERAVRRAIEPANSDDQSQVPFRELVGEAQSRTLRVVRSSDQ